MKEIYNTNSIYGYEFGPHRVISGTIASGLASLLIKTHYFGEKYGWALIAFGSFVLGLLGFEIFKNLCSIDGIYNLIDKFRGLMAIISGTGSVTRDPTHHKVGNSDIASTNKSVSDNNLPNISNDKVRIRRGPDDE